MKMLETIDASDNRLIALNVNQIVAIHYIHQDKGAVILLRDDISYTSTEPYDVIIAKIEKLGVEL